MWDNVEGYVDFPYRDTETRFLLGPCDTEVGRSRVRIDSESGSKIYDMVLIGDQNIVAEAESLIYGRSGTKDIS